MSTTEPKESAGQKPVYENDRYWTQRLEREFNLAGVGHAGVGLAFNRWAYKVRRKVLLRTLRKHGIAIKGVRLLELGFGTGFYLDLWRESGVGHVSGFDITEIAVKAARERFADTGWSFEKADIGAPLPLGDKKGTFDIATAFDVLFHLVEDANWNGALDNIAMALKPDGHAIVFDKYQSVENAISHVRRRTLNMYREALTKRGFEVVDVRPIFFLMNSPTDLTGISKLAFKTSWSLTKLPYKLGKHVGLGEILGGAIGAGLYLPELALNSTFSGGPSTKLLIARKK
ncbi:MAG TPA: class I SAM-dependent methyltransferase [Planctomycetota bacterium]|nr:class I SAM-dependent methyltransferase [Planctomycetota bacterium]